ncbi:MAG: UDP-glucose 4-epimerase GalE [Desulfovibrionaceae bacterium]|nr:UDP-glucose 4-epimerase GalE [Desulfovibrionaceae bacterium]
MKVLVLGGAGYIGSHTCKYLATHGHDVITYDNLSTGHLEFVKWGPFVYGDIRDYANLRQAVHKYNPDGLIHFAASAYVSESVSNPGQYYDNNVLGSLRVMEVLRDEGVRPLVVSSSCAVYGVPTENYISERLPLNPINPYGRTKLIMEWMLQDFAHAHQIPWMALRYFNAAGADPECEIGEWHTPETHLIPNVLNAILNPASPVNIFGDDYPTSDGTCIRDYIHVLDLAKAHFLALEYLYSQKPGLAVNLGTGQGKSILDIIATAEAVTAKKVPHKFCPRRPCDPSQLVASAELATKILNWIPEYTSIDKIITTAWQWACHKSHN